MSARVLIVENDLLIRRLLVVTLERDGLEVEAVHDGAEALERILSGRFGVVLLDLMLPHLSGYDIMDACARAFVHPRPLFFVTTAFDAAFRQPLDPTIVTAVIRMPFDISVLREIVRDCASAWPVPAVAAVIPPTADPLLPRLSPA